MLLTPRFPPLDIPTTGLIPYLFDNPCNISDDKKVFIDVHSNAALTFGQVKDGVLQLAAGLQDVYGFGDGDVLALFAPNSVSGPLTCLSHERSPRAFIDRLCRACLGCSGRWYASAFKDPLHN